MGGVEDMYNKSDLTMASNERILFSRTSSPRLDSFTSMLYYSTHPYRRLEEKLPTLNRDARKTITWLENR